MPTSHQSPNLSSQLEDRFKLDQVFKQFSLESERLETAYSGLQERFKGVQQTVQESNTRLAGKLAELDFTSRYLKTILDHISQGILFIDLNGIITTYNSAAQKILQIPEKDLLFHHFHTCLDDAFLGFSLREAFETKECPHMTHLSKREGEGALELEVEATFVSMSQEAYPLAHRQASSMPIQGLLVLLRDTTALRRLQQLASHQDRLKALGELAAHLAHEIRNPLGGIKGFATLLKQELVERSDLQSMAASIVEGADDLNCFVSNVLQYVRPFHIHLEQLDIMALIEDVKHLMQMDSAWDGTVEFSVESDVSPFILPIDPHYFRSALLNLFVNAVQAMPEGGTLNVKVEDDGFWGVIAIEDTGEGITPENMSKLFSPFFTTKEAGNGLGLAEVHKVMQEHQGTIEVQSELGVGTKFILKVRK